MKGQSKGELEKREAQRMRNGCLVHTRRISVVLIVSHGLSAKTRYIVNKMKMRNGIPSSKKRKSSGRCVKSAGVYFFQNRKISFTGMSQANGPDPTSCWFRTKSLSI